VEYKERNKNIEADDLEKFAARNTPTQESMEATLVLVH
jgi:hypothetical protein